MAEYKLIEVEGLSVTLSRRRILEQVRFAVGSGEIVGILGPNGAGKSTALHAVTSIVKPTEGTVRVAGHDVVSREAKAAFGFAPDDLPFPMSLSGGEVLKLFRRIRGDTYDEGLADELLELLGLAGELEKPVGDYSHGMRRKLQLIASLAHRPQVLILDEPMRGLDPEAAVLLRVVMERFREAGGGVLVATHDLLAAERYCDRVVVLADGVIVAEGRPEQIILDHAASDLEEVFLRTTGLAERIAQQERRIRDLRFVAGAHVGAGVHERSAG